MKSLLILLICLLTVYAPMELTRVIVEWGLSGWLVFEVCFIWLFYTTGIFLVSIIVGQERIKLTGKAKDR